MREVARTGNHALDPATPLLYQTELVEHASDDAIAQLGDPKAKIVHRQAEWQEARILDFEPVVEDRGPDGRATYLRAPDPRRSALNGQERTVRVRDASRSGHGWLRLDFDSMSQRPHRDLVVYRVGVFSWVDDPEMFQRKILQDPVHRSGNRRCFVERRLGTVATPVVQKEQVNLGSSVRCPEIRLRWSHGTKELLESEALPRCTHARVRQETGKLGKAQESVQQPRVAKVDLGRLYLSLANVLVPRL